MDNKKIGLFCLHGFLESGVDSYYNFRLVLEKKEITDYLFINAQGHGINEDINDFNENLVIRQIEEEYTKFKEQYNEVYLIGFSMGGVLASYLAAKYGADKLVLIAPAFSYGFRIVNNNKILEVVKKVVTSPEEPDNKNKNIPNRIQASLEKIRKELVDELYGGEEEERKRFLKRLKRANLNVFITFTRLINKIKRYLAGKNIDIPTRIYISSNDEIVPIEAAFYIYKKISNINKRIIILSNTKHRLFDSQIKDEIIEEILDFLYK